MEATSLDHLRALIDLLRSCGVAEYKQGDLHLRFAGGVTVTSTVSGEKPVAPVIPEASLSKELQRSFARLPAGYQSLFEQVK